MAIKGKELIEKKNVLNELRSNNMTLQELRFFSIYLSKINARDKSTRVVRFSLSDFQKIMDFGRLNIRQLQASTNSLLGKVVNVPNENGLGYTGFTLFKRCKVYQDDLKDWYIEIEASDDALPLMFDFKSRYFTYELWNALRLKSANQVRMYEILKQYERIGKRELRITELRELLGIAPNEYPRWNNFKIRVLDSCQQALAETTDIRFTYERGKVGNGGKWLTIIFHIEKNEDYIDQLTLDEFIDMQPEPEINEEELLEKYSSDELGFLAEACDFEFSNEEMRVLQDKLIELNLERNGTVRYDYLTKKFHEVNANKDIPKNAKARRFGYIKWLIDRDIEGEQNEQND